MIRLDVEKNEVVIPYWYWKAITTYVIDTEAAIERLEVDVGGEE